IVKEKNLEDQVVLMSFDSNIINTIQNKYPHIKVSYLLYRKGIEKGLRELTKQPEYISPYYKQLKNAETVTSLQNRGLKVVPWTVNSKNDILNMLNYGVDGIISDYPERVLKEKNKLSPK
ncbi:MAG: glycerophosphodiester phosphodiesterase family protein, partial [Salinimicrobium sediminis]|nr:glycerophosphodiester phosphodiesterase family protein [Salinimicrobium sediminis]